VFGFVGENAFRTTITEADIAPAAMTQKQIHGA
jgi:hypothetical protein